ncbi:hypothetical protein ACSBR2_040182 [Camellia fascicularis]
MSTGTSTTWPRRMCACGYGQCLVKISRSHKNPRRAYYACLRPGINKNCAKFRTKTLEHRDLMEIVFTGAAATRKHHWTLGEKTVEDNEGSSDSVQSLDMQPFAIQSLQLVLTWRLNSQWKVLKQGGKRKRNTTPSSGKSRKPTSGAFAIAESMNNLTNVMLSQYQQVTIMHLTGNESLYTISECMERLKSIPTLIGTLLFHFASSLMDNAD